MRATVPSSLATSQRVFYIPFAAEPRRQAPQQCQCQAPESREQQPHAAPAQRREVLLSFASAVAIAAGCPEAQAIQGSIAGRIPGLTGPDAEGFLLYQRPEGKSGGHGVGWSEIPRYSFKIPQGWEETPVSIADLGGTEIDLRFGNREEGSLFVVVAPVLRFADVGYNADVRITELGPPDRIISGFAPELFGKPLTDDDVLATETVDKGGLTYYNWEVKPHHLVAATAVGNRLFILATNSNSRQWRKAETALRVAQHSFTVPNYRAA